MYIVVNAKKMIQTIIITLSMELPFVMIFVQTVNMHKTLHLNAYYATLIAKHVYKHQKNAHHAT